MRNDEKREAGFDSVWKSPTFDVRCGKAFEEGRDKMALRRYPLEVSAEWFKGELVKLGYLMTLGVEGGRLEVLSLMMAQWYKDGLYCGYVWNDQAMEVYEALGWEGVGVNMRKEALAIVMKKLVDDGRG